MANGHRFEIVRAWFRVEVHIEVLKVKRNESGHKTPFAQKYVSD